jgi:hypothetical protein
MNPCTTIFVSEAVDHYDRLVRAGLTRGSALKATSQRFGLTQGAILSARGRRELSLNDDELQQLANEAATDVRYIDSLTDVTISSLIEA